MSFTSRAVAHPHDRRTIHAVFTKVEGDPAECERCGAFCRLWDADFHEGGATFLEAVCYACVEECRLTLTIAAQLGGLDVLIAVVRPCA